MLIGAFSVHMPVSSFFIPEEQIDEHDTGKAEGRDAVCVKNLQKGIKTKKENRVSQKNGCEGGFLFPKRRPIADGNKKKAQQRVPVDKKNCHRKLLCVRL